MKNIIFLIFTLSFIVTQAQVTPEQLLGLPRITSAEREAMLTNLPPLNINNQGNLVFDTTLNKVFEFNGTEWKQLLEERELANVVPLTTNYTLLLSNNTDVLTFDSTTDIVLTVPTGLPVGYNISIYQIGSGNITIIGSGGTQIRNRLLRFKTAGINAGVGLICTSTNTFHLTGDLKR